MPKRIPKHLEAIGVVDKKNIGNGQVELYIDPNKANNQVRKTLAHLGEVRHLEQSKGSVLYNSPSSPDFYEGPTNISNVPIHDRIRLAQQYFQTDPLVGKIIEIMTTFANDGFKNEHEDPKIKSYYDEWCKAVQIELVFKWIFLEYFKSGNVITVREMIPFNEKLFNNNNVFDFSAAAKKKDWSKRQIPVAFTVINPLTVTAKEDENNPFKDSIYKNNSVEVQATISDQTGFNVKDGMSNKIKDAIKNSNNAPLSETKYQRILRMRQPYECYGSILMQRAFNSLYEKNKMRQIDLNTMNSAMTQLIKVTVGNDAFPATPKHIKAVASSFQNVGKSQMIFWNHTLQIEAIKTQVDLIPEDRYARIDADIRNAFGVSEILLGGGGSKTNFATSYLSLKAFITNLVDARKDVLRWLDIQYRDVAKAAGFDSYPTASFSPLSLTDEIAEKQLFMQMVDRGIISYQTAQSQLGFDPAVERARREAELPDIQAGILGFVGSPYQQTADSQIVDTKKESSKNVTKQDKQKPTTSDQAETQKNRSHNKAGDPSVSVPNKGDQGRPKGPGKPMPNRKTQKIKGQGSEIAS